MKTFGSIAALAGALFGGAACDVPSSKDLPDTACSVSPSTRQQAVYEPPQMISVLVPGADGGVLECKAGTDDGCDVLFALDCPVGMMAVVDEETHVDLGIVNLGTVDLTVVAAELLDEVSDPAFTIGAFPGSVAPDRTETLRLAFHPLVAGAYVATLRIVSDALNAPDGTIELPVEGTAVE